MSENIVHKSSKIMKKKKPKSLMQKLFNIFKLSVDDVTTQTGALESEGPVSKNPIQIESNIIEQLNTKAANAGVLKVDTEATYLPLHDLINVLIQQNLNKKRLNKGLVSSLLPAEEVNFAIQQAFEIKYGKKRQNQITQDQDNTPENNDKQPSNRKTTKPRL